ncbi:hypothetical protein FQN54_001984 [Arachnomyces sp. PD_36]|nr:hypothetical protein FQN54_001984 [Arachnomyces sp. PD_36]
MLPVANISTFYPSASRPHVEPAIPASPPSSYNLLAENNILRDSSFLAAPPVGRSVSPGAVSLQAARSPGQSLVSSPNPPALPVLPKYRGGWDSLSSSPEHRRTDSSAYYTTAWGSPYATPSPPRPSRSLGRLGGINFESRDSSPFPIPEPPSSTTKVADTGRHTTSTGLFSKQLYSSVGRSAGRDFLAVQGGKSIKDFTQDWINQHLSGERRSERTNWLSDDSGSEAGSYLTAYNHLGDDQSEGWLGLEDDSRDEDLLKTPTTLASFVRRKANARGTNIERPRLRAKHLPAKSTDTLKQADFWDFAYDKDASSPNMSETASPAPVEQLVTTVASGSDKPISPVDKPLPPPPVSEQADAEQPASSPLTAPTPVLTQKPVLTPSQSFQRPKKRLVWRGKACVIALPLEDQRGSLESGPLLTPADVEARLKQWESEGFDTRGFEVNLEEPSSLENGGQSRPSYPDAADVEVERKQQQQCVVSFPDQSEWEDYVEFLKEEKLRALGVSLGEIEPQNTVSPASVSMSQTPSLPMLPLSPPVPTSSVAANHLNMAANPFSPHFNQSANNSHLVSLASPSPHINGTPQPTSHTPIFGTDQTQASAYPFPPYQPTPPTQGTFSPQNFFNLRQNDFTPMGANGLSNLNNVMSPVSPLHFEGAEQYPANNGDLMDLIQPQRAQTPPNQQDQMAQDYGIDESEPLQSSSNLEIAHPTPRGHRHNVSETLQKGVEQAESRLEDTIHQQLEDEKQRSQASDLMKSRWAIPEEESASAKQQVEPMQTDSNALSQVHMFGAQEELDGGQDDKAEIDTNPSISGTPAPENEHTRNSSLLSWQRSRGNTASFLPGHQSKPSESALNVEAKAFDPTRSFASNNFSFGGNSFQPSSSFQGSTSIFNPESSAYKPLNPAAGSFNVTAPAFTPSNFRDSASSGSTFKFSAASFNVEAPVFNPGRSLGNSGRSSLAGSIDHTNAPNKIFGDINIPHNSKPARRSKAIPIIRPDDVDKDEKNDDGPEHVEDADGRTELAQSRQKRARRGPGDDGAKEPEFAIPSHPLTETGQSQSPAISLVTAEGKENASPEGTKDTEQEVPDLLPATPAPKEDVSNEVSHDEVSELVVTEPERDLDISELEPSQVDEQEPAPQVEDVEETKEVPETTDVAPTKAPVSEEPPKPRTSLSAFAKPFEFKPSIPSLLKPSAAKKKPAGLEASRYAVISPPSSPKADDSPTLPLETESEATSPHQEEAPVDKVENFRDTAETTRDSPDEPSFQEIDAVMKQLNEDNSEIGIERITTPANRPIPPEPEPESDDLTTDRLEATRVRSHAPSPSPRRMQVPMGHIPKLNSNLNLRSPAVLSPNPSPGLDVQSPVYQLHSTNEHLSDWDDAISSGEDEKLQNRSRFFDTHVNELVGGILEDRLNPLERTLSVIQHSVALLSSRSQSRRPERAASAEHSDADDEDEEDSTYNRSRSPMNKIDRRADKIKNAVIEALSSHKPTPPEPAPTVDLSQIHNSLAEIKLLTAERPQHEQPVNVKNVIEEAILNHPRLNDLQSKIDQDIGAENMKLQVDGLKSMLRLADERAEQEYDSRRKTQDDMAEARRLQKIAEEEAARYREVAEEAERKLREVNEQKTPEFEKIQKRSDAMQEQQETLELTLSELSEKNIALQGTLDEYRLSSDQWRAEVEEAKNENKGLRGTISNLKVLVSETTHSRQTLREKFHAVQEDMVSATQNIARDQAAWRRKEEELKSNYAALRAAYDREVKLREKLEFDIHDLEQQEKEATKLKVFFGQSEKDKERLEEQVAQLRSESQEYQNKAARFEREFNDARESSRVEIQRVRTAMEADVDAANNQVNHIRAEYENQVARLQNQLETLEMDADTAKERHELQLEEAKDAKAAAVQDAIEAKDNALQDQRQSHERSLNDLRERHARVLHNASEDKQRSEAHLAERLSLKDDQIEHLKDKVSHLEEKVEIAKSAARAAAEAAQTQAGKGGHQKRPSHSNSPSMSFAKGSAMPDKISPQALRESILVLQDQLQQREGRIEELEGELSHADPDAPAKIKEKDTEINWLRELLGVRVDDLQDIIDRLSQPSFNQYAVRDAAIRLKANLQMEQQEKERAMSGGQSFPSISSISNFASSPRSLPLAAAAAWGNWRKGRENSVTSNVSDSTVGGSNHQTPSKSNVNPQGGFLSGLLTPPSSHVRQTPTNSSAPPAMRPMGGRNSYAESRPLRGQGNSDSYRGLSARQMEKRPQFQDFQEPPRTPPLLRNSSYDQDAEANNYGDSAYGVDDGEGSMIGGYVTEESAEAATGPFGPQIPS